MGQKNPVSDDYPGFSSKQHLRKYMQQSVAPNKSTDIKQNVIHELSLTAVIWF